LRSGAHEVYHRSIISPVGVPALIPMSFSMRQPECICLASMTPVAAIRVAMSGKAKHWNKRAPARGIVNVFDYSPVTTGTLTTP